MKKLLVSIFLGALSFPVFALTLDKKASSLVWTGTKVTGKHYGKIFFKDVKIKNNKGSLVGSEFIVDMNSMTVDDLSGDWAKKFLTHIKSDDFFEVKKYPTAKFVIDSVTTRKMNGKLTIKGKTHPVSFYYKKRGNTYTGKFSFDRTKFNMIYGSKSFFKSLGDKAINNEVNLDFKIVFKK